MADNQDETLVLTETTPYGTDDSDRHDKSSVDRERHYYRRRALHEAKACSAAI